MAVLNPAWESCISRTHGWYFHVYGPGKGSPITRRCAAQREQLVRVLLVRPSMIVRLKSAISSADIVFLGPMYTGSLRASAAWRRLMIALRSSRSVPYSVTRRRVRDQAMVRERLRLPARRQSRWTRL